MTRVFVSLSMVILCFTCCTESVTISVNANDFEEKLRQTVAPQLVDVRTSDEYNESHLPEAINMDVNRKEFNQSLSVLDKTRPVFVYCRSGKRSLKAASILEKNGFTEIYNLKGGILEWKEKYPLYTPL